jgi:3D (Asp-Asp-Asp) domain-containing protein
VAREEYTDVGWNDTRAWGRRQVTVPLATIASRVGLLPKGEQPRFGRVRPNTVQRITKGLQLLLLRYLLVPVAFVLALMGLLPPFSALADTTFQPGQTVVVVGTDGRGLKVRGGPGMAHRVVATVAEGGSVTIVAGPVSDGDDDWYQVSSPASASTAASTTGWAVGTYLTVPAAVRSMSTDDGSRVFLGRVTAYSDGLGGVPVGAKTYSGTKTRWGVVAVDPKVIPIGSTLRIEGYDDILFVAEDVGSGIKGDAVDIWLPDASTAKTYGTQYRRITVVHSGPDTSAGTTVPSGTTPFVAPTAPIIP